MCRGHPKRCAPIAAVLRKRNGASVCRVHPRRCADHTRRSFALPCFSPTFNPGPTQCGYNPVLKAQVRSTHVWRKSQLGISAYSVTTGTNSADHCLPAIELNPTACHSDRCIWQT